MWVTDLLGTQTEMLSGPPLLEFAGIAPTTVPALALSDHVSQKLHAWAVSYGRSGLPSSRSKDLADLVIMAGSFEFQADELRRALERTFEMRGTPLPEALPPLPGRWQADYRKVAARLGLSSDVQSAWRAVATFLEPILASLDPAGTWDPSQRRWT